MTELDDVLRQSFARIAEPGDPAGVADALRARMAAGDTGTPAATSGFRAGRGWFWPFLALAVVLGVLGGALGASGAFTSDIPAAVEPPSVSVETGQPTATPSPTATPTVTVTPTVEPVETGQPTAEPLPPAPVADVSGPTLGGASRSPSEVFAADSDAPYCDIVSTISVVANDNVAVTGVLISWTGVESGSGQMVSGPSWTYSFNPAQTTPTGDVTFTLIARDAAGNTSAPATTTVKVWSAGSCLI